MIYSTEPVILRIKRQIQAGVIFLLKVTAKVVQALYPFECFTVGTGVKCASGVIQ